MPRLHRPTGLNEACRLMSELDSPLVYGGGTAIQILLKQDILFADDFVDLGRVPGLSGVDPAPGGLRIGTMASLRRMETDAAVRARAPLAATAYRHVANPRVRNTATVGGNIAHGDYRLDPPTALLALDAAVRAQSVQGTRDIPVRAFFTDFQETALAEDEVIHSLFVPDQPPRSGAGFIKQSSLGENDWPSATAAVLVVPAGSGREVRLGLGALAPTPVYGSFDATGMDEPQAVAAATELADTLIDPLPDIRGSAEYKRKLGLVAVRDAVRHAWKESPDD